MPCVQIHMIRGVRTPEQIKKLADVVQQCMLDKFNAPPKDRYQVSSPPSSRPVQYPSKSTSRFEANGYRAPQQPSTTPRTPQSILTLHRQIITQHEPYELICEDTNLGLQRTDALVFVHVFQQGRDAGLKQQLYAALAERLHAECGLAGGDLIVSCSANQKEDWSFGGGRAQFLTGEL